MQRQEYLFSCLSNGLPSMFGQFVRRSYERKISRKPEQFLGISWGLDKKRNVITTICVLEYEALFSGPHYSGHYDWPSPFFFFYREWSLFWRPRAFFALFMVVECAIAFIPSINGVPFSCLRRLQKDRVSSSTSTTKKVENRTMKVVLKEAVSRSTKRYALLTNWRSTGNNARLSSIVQIEIVGRRPYLESEGISSLSTVVNCGIAIIPSIDGIPFSRLQRLQKDIILSYVKNHQQLSLI